MPGIPTHPFVEHVLGAGDGDPKTVVGVGALSTGDGNLKTVVGVGALSTGDGDLGVVVIVIVVSFFPVLALHMHSLQYLVPWLSTLCWHNLVSQYGLASHWVQYLDPGFCLSVQSVVMQNGMQPLHKLVPFSTGLLQFAVVQYLGIHISQYRDLSFFFRLQVAFTHFSTFCCFSASWTVHKSLSGALSLEQPLVMHLWSLQYHESSLCCLLHFWQGILSPLL
jgi:hypothetical protein